MPEIAERIVRILMRLDPDASTLPERIIQHFRNRDMRLIMPIGSVAGRTCFPLTLAESRNTQLSVRSVCRRQPIPQRNYDINVKIR